MAIEILTIGILVPSTGMMNIWISIEDSAELTRVGLGNDVAIFIRGGKDRFREFLIRLGDAYEEAEKRLAKESA